MFAIFLFKNVGKNNIKQQKQNSAVETTATGRGNLRKPTTTTTDTKDSIEVDDEVRPSRVGLGRQVSYKTQYNAPWNLDRIDQVGAQLNTRYTYNRSGFGVQVYVLDSGIRTTHTEFSNNNRASCGFNAIQDESCQDFCGHGTHVAGIVGGKTYGVAKDVTLIAVKILNSFCFGSRANVLAGIDYVIGRKKASPKTPMVINLSIQGKYNQFESDAVQAAVTAGITVVVAAGNSGQDACNSSPALVRSAITVGSTTTSPSSQTRQDSMSSYSNYGTCIDIFAPGDKIPSSYGTGDNDVEYLDGTSMASPHVAGVAATYLESSPLLTPNEVFRLINSTATLNIINNIKVGSPNVLLRSRRIFSTSSRGSK
jgi:aqualysin 1